jgi:DNA topoisomerase I
VSKLVIVESPAKAKTIKKYLGKDFEVLASFGHVRQLPRKNGAVNPDHQFSMDYHIIAKNAKYVDAISNAMQQAEALYLATDPDREGEAISWHLLEILKDKHILQNKPFYRVEFHEITKNAIQQAVDNPRTLSMDLINAQKARVALDYLVGFNLSPLLWKKIRSGLSAGRVQSPALRLIVEREQEIEQFKPREYWVVKADCQKTQQAQTFKAKLNLFETNKITQFSIGNEEQATQIKTSLLQLANGQLQVAKIEKKERKRKPSPPFTTSTLQQEAARKLGFTTKKTMQIAQQLYEGIDIGKGAVGLITYMRTDSVNLATEAVTEIREVITELYGQDNLPSKPRQYKTKSKNAQEAHEAIRPTSAKHHPDELKKALKADQLKLYSLIWKRTLACQMVDAKLNTVAVDLKCGEGNNFRANGSIVAFPGFLLAYEEGVDDKKASEDEDKMLPPMEIGEYLTLTDILATQHFTEPPPRFSEASLVKSLEEFGIGRPSTYASIISTLEQREYVKLDKKRFIPTEIGSIVNKFLTAHFQQYVDYDFTAKLEDELDAVSRGEQEWIPLMERFWSKFKGRIDEKAKTVQRQEFTQETLDEKCPKCNSPLNKRLGKRGHFIGCSAYPKCDYTRNIEGEESNNETTPTAEHEIVEGRTCPKCGSALHKKKGPYGQFVGCSNYPKCKHTEPLEKPVDTGVTCPACGKSTLIKKKTRYNFAFSCSECKYIVYGDDIKSEPCPNCNWPIMVLKSTKRRGTQKICPQKECGHTEQVVTE